MKCPNCGFENNDKKFCVKCGTSLRDKPLESINLHQEGKKVSNRPPKKFLGFVGICGLVSAMILSVFFIVRPVSVSANYKEAIQNAQKYLEQEEYEKAEDYFLKAIEIDPKQKEAYEELADLYTLTNQEDKAEDILTEMESSVSKETNSQTTDKKDEGTVKTDLSKEDIELFEEMINSAKNNWDYYSTISTDEQKYRFAVSKLIERESKTGLYTYFFGDVDSEKTHEVDPEPGVDSGRDGFNIRFYMDANKVDWILENVLNVKPNHKMEENRYYYDDDTFVYGFYEYEQSIDYNPKWKVLDIKQLDKNQYLFATTIAEEQTYGATQASPPSNIEILYYVCELKNDKDLGKYWSLIQYYDVDEDLVDQIDPSIKALEAYSETITDKYITNNAYAIYHLYDIDNDGISELILADGTCEADKKFIFYTYDGSVELIDEQYISHSILQKPDKENEGVYVNCAHAGLQQIYRITLKDKTINCEVIIDQEVTDSNDYVNYETIESYLLDDNTGLVNALLDRGNTLLKDYK